MGTNPFEGKQGRTPPGSEELLELVRMLADAALKDPDVSEEGKTNIRLMMQLEKTRELLDGMMVYAVPEIREDRKMQLHPLRREVLEYLQLVHMGLREFIRTHPVPEETK